MFWKKKKSPQTVSQPLLGPIARRLLADLEARGEGPCRYAPDGFAPLHRLVQEGNVEALKALLKYGVDPNLPVLAPEIKGLSPLHLAATTGHVGLLELLIQHGAHVNHVSEGLDTPLHYAAFQGHAPIITALLAHGADPTLRNDEGKTAWDYAREQGHAELAPLLTGSGRPQDTRASRLGYSLCAMLDEAKRRGLYQHEDNFPVLPEYLPAFTKASHYFYQIIGSREPRLLQTLMHQSCRYLWGKAIEAAFLWAKSPDGNLSIAFEPGDMARQTITTDLPAAQARIVVASQADSAPYFQAHQRAMLAHQAAMSPERMCQEILVTLEYFPRIGMAYAMNKGYHESVE